VAAPAFKDIAAQALAHLAVPPSREAPVPVPSLAQAKGKGMPVSPPLAVSASVARSAVTVVEPAGEGSVRVPELLGQAGREAVSRLLAAGLHPELSGSGRVLAQNPAPGAVVEKGSRVTLELSGRQ